MSVFLFWRKQASGVRGPQLRAGGAWGEPHLPLFVYFPAGEKEIAVRRVRTALQNDRFPAPLRQ